jgi:predicted amidophosphoribosyltransferase
MAWNKRARRASAKSKFTCLHCGAVFEFDVKFCTNCESHSHPLFMGPGTVCRSCFDGNEEGVANLKFYRDKWIHKKIPADTEAPRKKDIFEEFGL